MLTHSYLEKYISYDSNVEGFDTILDRLYNTDISDKKVLSDTEPSLDPSTKKLIVPEIKYSFDYYGNLYKTILESTMFDDISKRISIRDIFNRLFSPKLEYRNSSTLNFNIRTIYLDYENILNGCTFNLEELPYFDEINKNLFNKENIIAQDVFSNNRTFRTANFLNINGKNGIFNNDDDKLLEAILNNDIKFTKDDIDAFLKILASEIVLNINYAYASRIKELEEKLNSLKDPDPNNFKKIKNDLSDYLNNFKAQIQSVGDDFQAIDWDLNVKNTGKELGDFFSSFWGKVGSAIFNNGNMLENYESYTDSLESGIQDLWNAYYQIYINTKLNFEEFNIFPIIEKIINKMYNDLVNKKLRSISEIKLFQLTCIVRSDFIGKKDQNSSYYVGPDVCNKVLEIANSSNIIRENYKKLEKALLDSEKFTL